MWIDNVIAFISPRWAANRIAWRQGYEELRNYDAGNDGRLNAGWHVSNQSAEMTDRYSRDILRARTRDLERNSDIMAAVLNAYKRNVIGHGFMLQAKTKDEEFNKSVEDLWKKWTLPENCDITGQQSFNDILRMSVVRKRVDGGILIVKRSTDYGVIDLQLQLMEVDELCADQVKPKEQGDRIIGGIEYNSFNRPVGYWFRQYSLDGFNMADPIYVPAEDVIFYFSKKRPSQIREISDMAPTTSRIRDVNEFATAVSVKQRVMACLAVFIKRTIPTIGASIGRSASSHDRKNYDGKTLSPGMIKELNEGDDIQVVNPQGQSADAVSFIKIQQRMVAAGQGVSYETAFRDMSETTYSSARQAWIEDDLTFEEETERIINVINNIYEAFLISAVLAGKIKAKDFFNNKDAYLEHDFIKRPKAWIDPQKEAHATQIELSTGIKTFKQVAAENGTDWRRQIDDMAETLEYAKGKGINLGGIVYEDGEKFDDNGQS